MIEVLETGGVPMLVAAVADGAGSAPRGAEGAEAVCKIFRDHLLQRGLVSGATQDAVRTWGQEILTSIREHLGSLAARAGEPLSAYATTFLGAVLGPEFACFLQVGDGAIVVRRAEAERWRLLFRPARGEYANETMFVTSDEAPHALQARLLESAPDAVVLFTDGLENVALHRPEAEPHGPFFDYVTELVMRAEDPHAAVRAFLASAPLRQRVDDDLTLVVAVRRTENEVREP